MRYRDLVETAPKGERVWKATKRKHKAMTAYQDTLRTIRQTAPADRKADREAKARASYQDRMNTADDALRSAMKQNP